MAGQLDLYKKEVFDFLRTVTIKFEPFAYLMGQKYMDQYGIADPHGAWNPYYINMCGDYAEGDTRMTVYSLETEEQVPFDKDLVKHYPKTAALYRIPHQEYTTLEERYPQNLGLIKSIAYPVPSMEEALKAPNLSLLACDPTLLEENERESIVTRLKQFLAEVRTRWWLEELIYEDMFATTFYCLLWQALPNIILTQRFLNIRTSAAHSFHVWEYLKSKSLGDYRDVLSTNQSYWLYRNIDYILTNQGKNSNLVILAQNLLEEIHVSLLYKDIAENTDEMPYPNSHPRPQFPSRNIIDDEIEDVESMKELNDRLYEEDLENTNTPEYVKEVEDELGQHPFNDLPTKFLELRKEKLNTQYAGLLTNFMLDTLMYRYSEKKLSYNVKIRNPLDHSILELYVGDMILLWYWSLHRSIGETPEVIPTEYFSHIAFQLDYPTQLRESVYWHSTEYPIKRVVNVKAFINAIEWPGSNHTFLTAEEFTENLLQQYSVLLSTRKEREQSNKLLYHQSMKSLFEDIRITRKVVLDFGKVSTFSEWRAKNKNINDYISGIEEIADSEKIYDKLTRGIMNALFPIDYAKYSNLVGIVRNLETIYTAVKNLFIQLGSYNVTYLESRREENSYLKIRDPWVYELTRHYYLPRFFDLIIPNLHFTDKTEFRQVFRKLTYLFSLSCKNELQYGEKYFSLLQPLDISMSTEQHHKTVVPRHIGVKETSTTFQFDQKINLSTGSIKPLKFPQGS